MTRDDLKVRSQDELGDLTTAINKMSGSLKRMILAISENAMQVASASEELNSTSQQITANSEETSAQANVVSKAAQAGQPESADRGHWGGRDGGEHQGDRQERD